MNSQQKFYSDESYLESPPLEVSEAVNEIIEQYKKLNFEDKVDFNRLLRELQYK